MAYIKKLVMTGFKSFARRTEVLFDQGINVVLGPNGSGKSNISDALCFALGRLSIKSMRAAKAKNLIFMGSKFIKPAKEASVELVFDNSDRAFNIEKDEIVLKRAVRANGQSIYKINDETKTRGDIIEMLARAGIDPHGFNIILQGQIQSIVRIHPEERRKIIEEVSGIAIYETRKEKALKELEKTEERLKEISAILRERTAYLKNLEKEKAQAEKFKELETTVKRAKASILTKKSETKSKEISEIQKSIEKKSEEREKIRDKAQKLQDKIESYNQKIGEINRHIQQATGLEQETLHNAIANLKAEIEGLRVRKESYENRSSEIQRRIDELEKGLPSVQKEIEELKKESPLMAKKAEELRKKKEELREIEEERKKLLSARNELSTIRERVKDRERLLGRTNAESEGIVKQLESLSREFKHRSAEECAEFIKNSLKKAEELRRKIKDLEEKEMENEKISGASEHEIKRAEKIREDVNKIDLCPLCQSKITSEHKDHVFTDCAEKIEENSKRLRESKEEIEKIRKEKEEINREIKEIQSNVSVREIELERHKAIKERKEILKKRVEEEEMIKKEIEELENRRRSLEGKTSDLGKIEEKYENKMLEIEEISSRTEEDLDTVLLYKEREIENTRNIIKRSKSDLKEIEEQVGEISANFERKSKNLEEKEEQERKLNEKFKKMFEDRDKIQIEIQTTNLELNEIQGEGRQIEEQVNYLKIGKAKLDAEHEGIMMEISEYEGTELLQGSMSYLEERLKKSQESLLTIGSINMRALEVYDEIKKEYDAVYEKVETLGKEKEEIMKIIEEIDKKKKKTFMKTFTAINELFTENFSKLSRKGTAYLEIENKEDIFAGGVNIAVKLAKGKYFDVTSLSGGEQTLVALSLLFAIQEFKPYHFYIFDEIDAALDKRNSERLSDLLHQYMKSGQYIIVTHNDAIILESNVLYGVSMHDGVSKILSLKVGQEKKE